MKQTNALESPIRSALKEENDCTVRAIVDAYEVSYEVAHGICERYGRRNGEGFQVQAQVLNHLGLKVIPEYIGQRISSVLDRVNKEKVYICLIMGHIFTIRHGAPCEAQSLLSWYEVMGNKRVIRLFEVKGLTK